MSIISSPLATHPDDHQSRSTLRRFIITTYAFPRDRVIGDAQVGYDTNWIGVLQLVDGDGIAGLGFFLSLAYPFPPQTHLEHVFARAYWPHLDGMTPESAVHRVQRPRGGNLNGSAISQIGMAVDQALWDLAARRAGLPLHRYLGATDDVGPRAYVSGLEFHLDDAVAHHFFKNAMQHGYAGAKAKLGHPDIGWDIARLDLVRDAIGPDADLMIDANESWTAAETLRRVEAFRKAGHELYWVEDPVLRSDLDGLKLLRGALGPVLLNAGEYLDARGKLELIAHSACDVINLDGNISDGLHLAWVAAGSGVCLALGNSNMNLAAHLGAALPAIDYVEDARLDTDRILMQPLRVEEGRFVLSDTPGHGLALSPEAAQLMA
ncbi:MAG: mandelate racemase [Novosphingobium sp.]|nr:mandelate racemase [Novosphingobium sp.]